MRAVLFNSKVSKFVTAFGNVDSTKQYIVYGGMVYQLQDEDETSAFIDKADEEGMETKDFRKLYRCCPDEGDSFLFVEIKAKDIFYSHRG